MDPYNPGQTPGEPSPPVWGPPPAPDQPGYGAPPPPPPPYGGPASPYGTPADPYGAPPADPYGAPPAPYGTPPAPYGAPPPAWGAPAPTVPAKRGLGKRILLGVGVVVVVIIALAIVGMLLSPDHAGKVIFTTDAPTADGAKTCGLGNQVTSVTAGTAVYANFFYKSRLSNETVTLTIAKDGTVIDTSTLTADQANGVDCVESNANLGDLTAGVYEFKLTTAGGETVSDGTLTIK
jgi:hypothetical protein